MKQRLSIVGFLLFLLFLPSSVGRAQDGIGGAVSRLESSASATNSLARLVAADFDNDQLPDGAVLEEAGLLEGKRAFRIELHLTAGNDDAITFSTVETGLSISALDVNRDGTPDLVVEKTFTHQRIQVYLNNGHGAFRQASLKDYPTSDPSGPNWRNQLSLGFPAACLPSFSSLEIGILQRIASTNRSSIKRANLWQESLLIQSGPRGPTASRAPPSFLSL